MILTNFIGLNWLSVSSVLDDPWSCNLKHPLCMLLQLQEEITLYHTTY